MNIVNTKIGKEFNLTTENLKTLYNYYIVELDEAIRLISKDVVNLLKNNQNRKKDLVVLDEVYYIVSLIDFENKKITFYKVGLKNEKINAKLKKITNPQLPLVCN